MNPKYQKCFEFDSKNQQIKIVDKYYWVDEKKKNVQWTLPDYLPEELKEFVIKVKNEQKKDGDNDDPDYNYYIDSQKYFFQFIQELTSLAPGHSQASLTQVQHRFQLSESPGAWSLLL